MATQTTKKQLPIFIAVDLVKDFINRARKEYRSFTVIFVKDNGQLRTMYCTLQVPEGFTNNVLADGERQKEDEAKQLQTVLALDVMAELINGGTPYLEAGHKSWRRIPLTRVVRIELR